MSETNGKNIDKATSFWNFLEKNKIEIPIIQRDYAQGRDDQATIRERFVDDLKNALVSTERKGPFVLDFVYGSKVNGNILPLDGQQRLTTLWLLHWYLAYKSGNLAEADIFSHFSYETRESSRDFIENLVKLLKSKNENADKESIRETIVKNTWFLKEWNNDQTAKSMLTMLDTIEDKFKEASADDINAYWQKLVADDAPIVFYNLEMEHFGLSDDLYIKMNARGKPLTSFENLKADLVNYLRELDGENKKENTDEISLKLDEKNKKESKKKNADEISRKLDTTWTDIFWKNKSPKNEIDEIYFAFLNRWFFNEWIANGIVKDDSVPADDSDDGKNKSVTADDVDKDKRPQSELYGSNREAQKEINDAKISYKKFDLYKEILESNKSNENPILRLEKTLDNFSKSKFLKSGESKNNASLAEIQKKFYPIWDEKSSFRFIPEYKKDETEIEDFGKRKISEIEPIQQMERPVFFAICKYFEQGEYEEKSFRRWMRFAWNLTSDEGLRDTSAMIQIIRRINECASDSHDIYEALQKADLSKLGSSYLDRQFREEREKAVQIISHNEFESKIEEAEKTAFFKGQIRFLYQNENGEVDWNNFEKKSKNAKNYFDKDGIKDVKYIARFISLFTTWEQLLEGFEISQRASCWKEILLNSKYQKPAHNFLLEDENFSSEIQEFPDGDNIKDFVRSIQKELCNEELLSYICIDSQIDQERRHPTMHWWWGLVAWLYPPNAHANWKIIILGVKRNALLSELYCGENEDVCEKGKITSKQKAGKSNFFWGKDIEFSYRPKAEGCNLNRFKWGQDDSIEKWKETTSTWEDVWSEPDAGSDGSRNIATSEDLQKLLEEMC